MELDERVRAVYDLNFTSQVEHDRGDVLSRFGLSPWKAPV